jgi:hypothetical protein
METVNTGSFVNPSEPIGKNQSYQLIKTPGQILLVSNWGEPRHKVGETVMLKEYDCQGTIIGTKHGDTVCGEIDDDEYEIHWVIY